MAAAESLDLLNSTLFEPDRRRQFIEDDTFPLLMMINPASLTFSVSVVGVVANALTIATFARMGFKETINVSLVTLAVTDMVSLVLLATMSLIYNPAFCGPVCEVLDLRQLEDFVLCNPRSYFTAVSGGITGLIAFERCVSVLRPLQVKSIITKGRVKVALPCIFVACMLPFLPFLYTTGVAWVINPLTNASRLTRTNEEHLHHVNAVAFGFVMAMGMTTFTFVAVFTGLIVCKLASHSTWRAEQDGVQGQGRSSAGNDGAVESSNSCEEKDGGASGGGVKKKGLSGRDRRATMTVTIIAVMYITCFLPGRVMYLAMSIVEDFNKGMFYTNLYDFMWYVAFFGESICCSSNIIVYFKSSTKFREAFLGMFGRSAADMKQKQIK